MKQSRNRMALNNLFAIKKWRNNIVLVTGDYSHVKARFQNVKMSTTKI